MSYDPPRPPLGPFIAFRRAAASIASPRDAIIEAVRESLAEAFGEEYRESNPLVTSATKPEFGDYQVRVSYVRRR